MHIKNQPFISIFSEKIKKFENKEVIFGLKFFYEVLGISWWNLHYLSLKWAEKHESENRIQLALKTKKLMLMVLWTLLFREIQIKNLNKLFLFW